MADKKGLIAIIGALVLGVLGFVLKEPVKDIVCGVVPPAAVAPAPAAQ